MKLFVVVACLVCSGCYLSTISDLVGPEVCDG